MASKVLAVRDDVYKKLLEAKKGNESFSDVIERLLEGRRDMMLFKGILANDKNSEFIEKDTKYVRKNTILRYRA